MSAGETESVEVVACSEQMVFEEYFKHVQRWSRESSPEGRGCDTEGSVENYSVSCVGDGEQASVWGPEVQGRGVRVKKIGEVLRGFVGEKEDFVIAT